MANFHTDFLVITANGEDMVKVLSTIAQNLNASEEINRDYDLSTSDDPLFAYCEVARDIDNWYWSIFPGEPSARPLSETANVRLHRVGEHYVLTIHYSTARHSNIDDVWDLIDQFPEGKYGFAFLDSDEGTGYEEIGYVFTSTEAMNGGSAALDEDELPYIKLMRLAAPYWEEDLVQESDLGKLAFAFATFDWPEEGWWGAYDDSASQREDPRAAAKLNITDHEIWRGTENIRYLKAQQEAKKRRRELDWKQLVGDAFRMVDQLPLRVSAYGSADAGAPLVPGMTLALEGEWWDGAIDEYDWGWTCGKKERSKLYATSEETGPIGVLDGLLRKDKWRRVREKEADSLVLLAPYLTAVIEQFVPYDHRAKNEQGSDVGDVASWKEESGGILHQVSNNLVARLELKPMNLEDLEKGLKRRAKSFVGSGTAETPGTKGGASW